MKETVHKILNVLAFPLYWPIFVLFMIVFGEEVELL